MSIFWEEKVSMQMVCGCGGGVTRQKLAEQSQQRRSTSWIYIVLVSGALWMDIDLIIKELQSALILNMIQNAFGLLHLSRFQSFLLWWGTTGGIFHC